MAEEFSTFPPIVDDLDWKGLTGHALEKPFSFLIRKDPVTSYLQAIFGKSSGSDLAGQIAFQLPNLGFLEIYEDDETFWSVYESGSGSYGITLSEELTEKASGTSSLKCVVAAGSFADVGFEHDYGADQDWSTYDRIRYYIYGLFDFSSHYIRIIDSLGNWREWDGFDAYSGWIRQTLNLLSGMSESATPPDLTKIRIIRTYWTPSSGVTRYFDRQDLRPLSVVNLALAIGAKVTVIDDTFLAYVPIEIQHGGVFEGFGEKTVIKQADGANLDALIDISLNTASEFGRFKIRNMVLDGNKANQTGGLGYGIRTATRSSILGDYATLSNLIIKDTYGIGLETKGNWHHMDNVHVRGSGGDAFVFKDYRVKAFGLTAANGDGNGFVLRGTGLHFLFGCSAWQMALNGIHVYGIIIQLARAQMVGGEITTCGQHGILFEGAQRSKIISVTISQNGTDGTTYDNIHFKSLSTKHSIRNLISLCHLLSSGKSRYHVRENDDSQDYNQVSHCQILDAAETDDISLQGVNSVEVDNM